MFELLPSIVSSSDLLWFSFGCDVSFMKDTDEEIDTAEIEEEERIEYVERSTAISC